MRAVLVDDEILALEELARQLRWAGVQVTGQFLDPEAAFAAVLQEEPDIVFLDIEMPGINGIQWADRLLALKPQQRIVFVTAYDGYAVEAFDLDAVDYLLKPIQKDRLLKTIQRLRLRLETEGQRSPDWPPVADKPVQAQLFGQVRLLTDDGNLVTPAWRTAKALELFAYLLHQKGGPVDRDTLLEILWPHGKRERSAGLLYTTVYQMRRALAQHTKEIQVISAANAYKLMPEDMVTDVDQWEDQLQAAPPLNSASAPWYGRWLAFKPALYLAPYDFVWAEARRHRLGSLWTEKALGLADYYLSAKTPAKALALYFEILERNPYAEQAHFGLMQCHALLGDRPAVAERYRVLVGKMKEGLALPPAPQITAWFEQWQQKAD